jgi:telomerase reverse transcriptase
VVQDYGRPRILQQKTGIAQGSILSTLLCNLYYGFNETELLDGLLVNNHSACQVAHVHGVFRVVDDFLFVSTEKEKAIRFLEKMHIGMPAKGIKVNGEKSRCSFDFRSDLVSVEKVVSKDAKGGYYFSWCGLLFNTDSGSVRIDYERFSGDRAIQSIFLKARGSEGLNLVTSMRGFVQPRATAILYDLRINTVYDINLNYCQAVLLCIIKTHTFITRMDGGYEKNPTFLLSAFEENLVYFYRLIRTRLQREKDEVASRNDSPAVSFTNALKLQSAKWLGIYLFSSFLVDRSSESHTMVALLRLRLFGSTLMNRKALKALADEALASFYLTVLKENNEH